MNADRNTGKSDLDGWQGWDEYAPFYDWENRRTMGRRDVAFWQSIARQVGGPVLELGCGTGRVSLPVARTGVRIIGVDRSSRMLARARARRRRSPASATLRLVRADIRALPFVQPGPFSLVMAPYGILQSLLDEADLEATLASVARAIRRDGIFGIDLVADLPRWDEYTKRVRLRGRRASGDGYLTLVETVRQDRARKLTIFDQEYVELKNGRRVRHPFSIAFRTLTVPEMRDRLERAGFRISAVLGDYDRRPWDPRAETWLILAQRG